MKTTSEHIRRAEELIGKMTVREKVNIVLETSPANERLGIPKYYHGNEALHGIVRPGTYTVFPQAIALGAMFDDVLLQVIADAISTESRARYHNKCADGLDEREFEGRYNGLLTFWSPDLNIARDPRWGRTAETYGEDPYLAGRCGIAFVKGLQGNNPDYLKAVATPKHFTANNEEHNRFECNAVMSEKSLREYYLEPFRMCVEQAKPEAVMAAYNAINGTPCHVNSRLLKDILRGEWGFDGYVVSDCGAVSKLWDSHKWCVGPSEAAAAAMNNGVDLECGSVFGEYLEEQVINGNVSEERLNEAVRRILVARIKTGQLDDESSLPWSGLSLDVISCKKHSDLSYEAAVKSAVLLKNNGILPLSADRKILVIGNNADKCQFGDYSGKSKLKPVSPLEGIRKHCPSADFVQWNFIQSSAAFRPVPAFCYVLDDGTNGINASFYDNSYRTGIPQSRVDEAVNYEWESRYPDPLITTNEFSCLFRGNIKIPLSGRYSFRVSSRGDKACCKPEFFIDGEKYGGEPMTLKKGSSISFMITYSKQLENPMVRLEWVTPAEINEEELFLNEVNAARNADCVIAVLGLGTEYESEGRDKTYLDLPSEQLAFLRKIYAVNKNIVLVVENGSALTLREPAEMSCAVLEAWYPGDRGGDAIADILFGRASPSGRLPLSFPESVDDLPAFDDYNIENGRSYMYEKKKPVYGFGYGLSYTSFDYSDISACGKTVSVTVANTGSYEADEVTQLYIDSAGLPNQPRYRLRDFRRIHIAPGQSERVVYELTDDSFALFDESGERKVFAGNYTVFVDGRQPDENSMRVIIPVGKE